MISSSRLFRQSNRSLHRLFTTATRSNTIRSSNFFLSGVATATTLIAITAITQPTPAAQCSAPRHFPSSDVLMLEPQKELSTGILFPGASNGMRLVGCGVRVKWHFVKVYAVGTYVDPLAMAVVKQQGDKAIEDALLDPNYPRTIRIVMNRALSIQKYTDAIVESLEPRMKGKQLEKLEEFKKLNPSIDLVEGAEIEMIIRGDTMMYKNAVGGMGMIQSDVFCRAMCDVYYGKDAVSPSHKQDVIKGIKALK